MLAVNIKAEDGFEPVYKHEGDAGADLRACIQEDVTIMPCDSAWVGTGVHIEIPPAHVGLQFPRSGLGCNHGICLANGVGVIDSGYRGEVKAKLLNLGDEPFTVHRGDRVCQLVVVPFARCPPGAGSKGVRGGEGPEGHGRPPAVHCRLKAARLARRRGRLGRRHPEGAQQPVRRIF